MHSQCLFEYWTTKYTPICPCPICRAPISEGIIISSVQMDILLNKIDRETGDKINNTIGEYYEYKWKETNTRYDEINNVDNTQVQTNQTMENKITKFFNKYFSPVISLFLLYFLVGMMVLVSIDIVKYILEIRPMAIYMYLKFIISTLKYKFLNMEIIRFAIYTIRQV
jgi:hypothetical protein